MTKAYALRKLLEHGPLSFGELMTITGWSKSVLACALSRLCDKTIVRRSSDGWRRIYQLD